jgi:hypothetical protein
MLRDEEKRKRPIKKKTSRAVDGIASKLMDRKGGEESSRRKS